MSDHDTTLADRALARLRAAQAAADTDPSTVDDDALLAVAHGELPPDREDAVMRQLATSSSLRTYLREVARPVDAVRAATALAAMMPAGRVAAPTDPVFDPFSDPLAPEPPAYSVSGPFGRIRVQMDNSPQSSDDVPVFGPDSVLEWHVHAPTEAQTPSNVTLWYRALDGSYTRAPEPTIETSGAAMRLSVAARVLFPGAGLWQIALVFDPSRRPPADGSGPPQSTFVARFDDEPDMLD